MGLREIANADMRSIINDRETGFGWPIKLTDPDGNIGLLTGLSDDISQIIDPDTGQAVSGRLASIVVSMADICSEGLSMPRGIADAGKKPWVVEFEDIHLNPFKFKVAKSNPDRMLGNVSCMLEVYS